METVANPGKVAAGRGAVVPLGLSMLLAALGTSIANIALPALGEAFASGFGEVKWVVVAYLAGLTAAVVIAGRLGDLFGRRRMHLAGLGLFSVASLLCGLATDLWFLVAARALQGVGAAFLMTLAVALLRDTAGEGRLGRAMGLMGTVSAVGTALGPSVGGLLVSLAGWPGVFLAQVPLALATLVLASLFLPRDADRAPAAAAGFRIPHAVDLSSNRLVPGLVANVLVAAVMMTTLVVGPYYLGLGLGLSEMQAGLVMSVGPAISILAGVPSGRAVDAFGASRVLVFGLVLLAAGAFALAFLPVLIGAGGYVLAIVILTPGYQLFQSANNTAVMIGAPADRRGFVSGLLGLSRNLGLVAGASLMASVFAFGVGTPDLADAAVPALGQGMRLVFLAAAAMMLAALWLACAGRCGR
jgi:MFS family permease